MYILYGAHYDMDKKNDIEVVILNVLFITNFYWKYNPGTLRQIKKGLEVTTISFFIM